MGAATGSSSSPNWFVVAVQTLTFLAQANSVCSSAMIADQAQCHPTFVRRVVAQLVRANLVQAHEGRDGGYCLARSAQQITLTEVYLAVKAKGAGFLPTLDTSRGPVLEESLRSVLVQLMNETEQSILEVLQCHTIAEIAAQTTGCNQKTDL